MTHRANVALSNTNMDKRKARRRGARGGHGKGAVAKAARDAAVPEDFVIRVVRHRGIPWPVKVEILGPPFTISTLRRHHGRMGD